MMIYDWHTFQGILNAASSEFGAGSIQRRSVRDYVLCGMLDWCENILTYLFLSNSLSCRSYKARNVLGKV